MKRLVVGAAVLALGVAGMSASSAAPSVYKVTGGGQILVPADGGPGATLAFQAQGDGSPTTTRGQLQYNDHNGLKFHADIDCLVVFNASNDDDDPVRAAEMAGTYLDNDGVQQNFRLYVEDHDNGGPQNQNEGVIFDTDASNNTCNTEDDDPVGDLGRGNIVIHKDKTA